MSVQLTLDIGLPLTPSLDDFEVGANGDLLTHLRLWLGPLGAPTLNRSPLPIYFWGESGAGKTHLLNSLKAQLQQQGERVGWLDPQGQSQTVFDPTWCAVLLDDVNALDAAQQQRAFQWFIDAQSGHRAVIAAGSVPPADLSLRDDLRSRLGWGHVFAVKPPDDAVRRSVLQSNAHARGLKLSDEVTDYLLTHFSRDLGSLVGLLDELDRYAMQSKRAITIPMIKDMMDAADGLVP